MKATIFFTHTALQTAHINDDVSGSDVNFFLPA